MAIMPPTATARWRVLYDRLKNADYGRSFDYAELSRMAGIPDVRKERWILDRTRQELVRKNKRFLQNERGVGYRVVEAAEHLGVGHEYRKKSMRAAGRSGKVLRATDLSRVTDPAVKEAILNLQNRMSRLEQMLRRQDERLQTTEWDTERLKSQNSDQQDRIEAVEKKLRELAPIVDELVDQKEKRRVPAGAAMTW